MNKYPELKPTRYDALVALAVLLLALALGARWWLPSAAQGDTLTVVVSIDGAETERVPLSDYAARAPHTYESRGYALTVAVADDAVSVTESTCPNQDCRNTPAIRRAGQSIVCLPARVVVALEGGTDPGYDLIAG